MDTARCPAPRQIASRLLERIARPRSSRMLGPGTCRPRARPASHDVPARREQRRRCRSATTRVATAFGGTKNSSDGDHPARPDDPGQLGQRRRRVVDVTEQVRERQRVEARLGEGQLLGAAGLEPNRASRGRPARRGRCLRPASPGSGRFPRQSSRSAGELDGDGGRARCDVQNGVAWSPLRPARRGSAASADPGRS